MKTLILILSTVLLVSCSTMSSILKIDTFSDFIEQFDVIDSDLCDPDPEIRKSALEKTNDSRVIHYFALNDRNTGVRKIALKKTNNTNTIHQVATKDKSSEIRKMALEKTNSHSTIHYLATKDKSPEIRKLAVNKSNAPIL